MERAATASARQLLVVLVLVACGCGAGPRDPVESILDAVNRQLRNDELWVGGQARRVPTSEGHAYLDTIGGNELELRALDAEIAAKESAVEILEVKRTEATETGLRSPGRDGLAQAHRFEAAVDALREEIRRDKDRRIELVADPRGGGEWLRYELVLRSGAETRKAVYDFRVEQTHEGWRVAEVHEDDAPLRRPLIPEKEAERVFNAVPR